MSKTEAKTELSYRERLKQGFVPQHRPGSRKAQIHEAYVAKGDEAASKLAKELKIKESTYKSWRADWRLISDKSAPAKPAKKSAVKKPPTKKATPAKESTQASA